MLPCIPKPSSVVCCPEPLLGLKTAELLEGGGSYVGCLLGLVGTAKPAGATFQRIDGGKL